MNRKFAFKYLFFFLLYFSIHYLEGLPPIGAFSFAQFWKIPLLLYLLVYALKYVRSRPLFEKASYGLSIESFFSPEVWLNPLSVLISASKQLPLVLFFRYWLVKFRAKYKVLQTILYSLAQYVCLSALPVLLGIVEPLRGMMSAESFGVEGLVYFSGVFGAPHAASSYFCIAILVLFHGFLIGHFKTRRAKIYNLALILVALVAIFKAYVRTGWLMLIVGAFCLLDFSKITVKRALAYVMSIGLAICGGIYLFMTNEAFSARLTGVNVYAGTGGSGLELSGSGRTSFWLTGIQNWSSNNWYQLLFGSGYTKVVEDNFEATGMRVFSHNQFVDTLAQNGLLGLVLLLLFYGGIYKFVVQTSQYNPYRKLSIAILVCSLIFSFFQNEMYFDFAVIFSLVLALCFVYSVKSRLV